MLKLSFSASNPGVIGGWSMKRLKLAGITAAPAAGALTLIAAQRPAALAQLTPGLWEFSGPPGAKVPLRQCVADVFRFARFAHRGLSCSPDVAADRAGSAGVDCRCGG